MEYSEQKKVKGASPLRLANTVHFALGSISVLLGVWVLLGSRDALQAADGAPSGMLGVAVAIILLLIGGLHITLSMSFWSFGFAPDDIGLLGSPGDKNSESARAASSKYLYTILDNGMIEAPAFAGPFWGALTAAVPMIAHAPLPIRAHAYLQLLKSIQLGVLLVGFLIAWVMTPTPLFAWVAGVFFLLAVAAVRPQETIRLIKEGRVDTEGDKAIPLPSLKGSIALLLFVVLAPVLLSLLGKNGLPVAPVPASYFVVPTILILVPSLIGSAFYFYALVSQAREFTSTDSRNLRRETPTSDLSVGILDAAESFVLGRFTRLDRGHQLQADVVQGWTLCETNPVQMETSSASSLAEAIREGWSSPMLRPLLFLELLGLAVGLAGLVLLTQLGLGAGNLMAALSAAGLLSAAQFCLLSAHRLWRRADFQSTIYRFRYKSTFQRISREAGNTITGHGKVTDTAVRATTGQIDCSVVRVSSVCFARGASRHLTAVDLDLADTQRMLDLLCSHDARIQQRLSEQDTMESQRLKLISSGVPNAWPVAATTLLGVDGQIP